MKRKLLVMTLLAATVLMAASAMAQKPCRVGNRDCTVGHGLMNGMRGDGMNGLCQLLDLSEEQTKQITKLHEDAREEILDVRKELLRLENEMEGELLKDDVSEKTVVGLVEEIGLLRTQIRTSRMSTRLAVRELLTEEQRDELAAMRMHRGGRGGGQGLHKGHAGHGRRGHGNRGHGRQYRNLDQSESGK